MKDKNYFTIVQNFDARVVELRQFKEIVTPNELLVDFHTFTPSMGVCSGIIPVELDYGFVIREVKDTGRVRGRFDFQRLETALEFSFKSRNGLYEDLTARLVKAQQLSMRKALYSMPFMPAAKQRKHEHFLNTIAKLQEIGESKPNHVDFVRNVKVEFIR